MSSYLDDYVPAHVRVKQFHERFPNGAITTEIVSIDEQHVRVRAAIFREFNGQQGTIIATGHSEEPRRGGKEKVLEKAETVAVARGLALAGFSADKGIASREEMESFHASGDSPKKEKKGERDHAALDTISDAEVKTLTPEVKAWIKRNPQKREAFKNLVVGLGVTRPNGSLASVLGQLPNMEAVSELTAWLGEQDSDKETDKDATTITPDELADKLVEEGVAVEEA